MWHIINLSEDKDVEVVKTKKLTNKNISRYKEDFCKLSYDIRKHLELLQNPFVLYRLSYRNKVLFYMIFEIKPNDSLTEGCVSTFYTENHFMSNITLSNEIQRKIINNFIKYKDAYK